MSRLSNCSLVVLTIAETGGNHHELSEGFAVAVLVLVVEHGEVRLVAALGDVMLLDGLQHGTAGFMGMGAVAEAAVLRVTEDFAEVAGQLLTLHVERAEALDARRVDEIGRPLQPPLFRGDFLFSP